MECIYLILDQGGHSTRALAFNEAGDKVADARCAVNTEFSDSGVVEQNPREMTASLDTVCAEIAAELGDRVADIHAVGLVTQRSSLVCWDKTTGEALSPVLSWQDTRASGSPQLAALDVEDVVARTGLRPGPHYGASKIRWCMDHLEEVSTAQQGNRLVCGPMATFLLFHLSGHLAADPANASRTLLWNMKSGEWDEQLLAHFEIPPEVMPPLQPSLSDFGQLTLAGREIPIRLVNGDQCAAFYGRGGMDDDTVYINAGTGVFIATPWDEAIPQPVDLLKTLVLDDGSERKFVAEGTVNGGASALDWAGGRLNLKDYFALEEWCKAELAPPIFLNGVGGLGAPFWRSQFRSEFIGGASARARMVAVLESIVFMMKINVERLQGEGREYSRIVLGGGLGNSSCFCRKLAALSGLPVFRPEEVELTSRGAAYLLAGQPDGWGKRGGESFEPESNRALHGRYRQWLGAIKERLN